MRQVLLLFLIVAKAVGDQLCIDRGGSCLEWKTNLCLREYVSGLCDGEPERRCCLNCDQLCQSDERLHHLEDGLCSMQGGVCQVNSNYCDGTYNANSICGGSGNRRCCEPTKDNGCPLITFDPTKNIKSVNGEQIKVASGFLAYMNKTAEIAKQCNVTMYVSQSFRKRQAPQPRPRPSRVYVAQPKRNNHLVGHAVNMQRLDTPNGSCNGQCLMRGGNKEGNCFINGLKEAGLKWGGTFDPPEPNLIEDNIDSNVQEWKNLLQEVQSNC